MTVQWPVVYRVQDRDGRGPYRPGMTDRWGDPDGHDNPSIIDEFGRRMEWLEEVPAGYHCGCAFLSIDQVVRWFSPTECGRLSRLGYRLVGLRGCSLLRRSERQAIVIRSRPFRFAAREVQWPHIDLTAQPVVWDLVS